MTNYPYGFDNNITLPGVSGSSQEDTAITALRSSVFAIEIELGITPSGIYPDVRTRLDILESRINFSTSAIEPGILNDGYVKSPLFIFNVPQNIVLSISDGYGVPTENRLDGSLYMRSDGTANHELYVRRGGQWYPIQTDLWVANCDLTGTYTCQEVVGIRNKPLSASLETTDGTQDGYHLTWSNADGYWRAETGFLANNDLAPAPGSGPTHGTNTGRTAQTVIGLQNHSLSSDLKTIGSLNDGYALIWENTDNHWDSQPLAVVWHNSVAAGDGYVTRRNIRSNRILQSPSTTGGGLIGMTNFGSSTNGSGGVSANYATILGGDQNTASGVHSLVVAGFSNSAQDGYSVVVSGNGNTATQANSIVLQGVSNIASGSMSTVLNGTSNIASGNNTTVSNGSGNTVAANFAAIFNGSNNTISLGSDHSLIYSGATNLITGGAAAEHSLIMGGDNNTVNSANNVFIGTTSSSISRGDYSVILSGVSNNIANLADYTAIFSGIANSVNASSEFAIIGTGNNNSVTSLYATILCGDTCNVNGLHGSILNGANNTVTGSYGTIINGNNNAITGSLPYGIILDGYNHLITGPGSFIGDGYNNTINGYYSSIINGNFNTINGRNSTILNGGSNTIDSSSVASTVITGDTNTFTNSANSTVFGSGNTYTNATSTFVIGTFNNVQSTGSFINGSSNTFLSGTSNNRIFGSNNTFGTGATTNFAIGNGNSFAPASSTSNTFAFGSNNTIDGVNGAFVNGNNNIASANMVAVHGQFGKARMFGQEVRANSRFSPGTVGQAQWSRLILTGTGASGSAITPQLQDSVPVNATFLDGYSYDIQLRILIVNTSNIGTLNGQQPVLPARMVYDILAHKELSDANLVLDNVNETLITPNTSDRLTRTPWTVSISTSGNQLIVTVDSEIASSEISTYSGGLLVGAPNPSDRRVVATLEMREVSRI